VQAISLARNKAEYFSDNLFASDFPIRVVVCLIEQDRKNGSYKNPFYFRRHYVVPVKEFNTEEAKGHSALEEKLNQIQRQLELVTAQLSQAQKGKTTRPADSQNQDPSILTRLRSSFAGPSSGPSGDNVSEVSEEDVPPTYNEAVNATTKTIFVKKIDLLLNGSPLDQLGT
jgi:hypothetical protein